MALIHTAEPTLGQTERERDTDLSTKRGQLRYLMDGLGLTRAQANNLIRAHVLDQRDREARKVSSQEFGSWLKSNYWPAVNRRPRGRASSGDWRVMSG